MAKLKKRSKISQQRHRANKIVNPLASVGDNRPIDDQIKDIFNNLNSQDNEVRLKSISSLTLLCDADPKIRKLALKNNLIKLLMTNYVLDKESSIRSCSLGLLRNLVIEEEYDMAIHLWRNDIWLVLENGFKSIELDNLDCEYIDSLIGLLDSICLELTSSIVDDSIIPKLPPIMKLFFEILNKFSLGELTNVKPIVSILQLLFDLSSISTKFLKSLSTDFNFIQASGPLFNRLISESDLAKIYIIGINFQICEFNDDLGNGQVDQVIIEIFNIINSIDVNGTISKLNSNLEDSNTKVNFQIIDTSLDLFSTMIEFTGYLNDTKGIKSDKFSGLLNEKIVPFLNQLICNGFKNDKLLICLNNSLVYLTSTKTGGDEGIKEMFVSMNSILSTDLNSIIENFQGNELVNIESISDLISFKLDLIEYISNPAEKLSLIQSDCQGIEKIIEISSKNLLDFETNEELNNDILVQYSTILIQYLTVIGKRCGDNGMTEKITKFIVDKLMIGSVSFYNGKVADKKLTIAKYHSQCGYIVENVLNEAINAVIEMFDDNYSYNEGIYHRGGLDKVLSNLLPEYKLIYKNIDKNQQFGLKKRSEDTLMNFGRFIIYKSTELTN